MQEPLLIGVDGGGTQCRARLCDLAGRTLGEAVGGPANVRADAARVMHSILTASRGAIAEAGLSEADLRRVHAGLGLAGAALTSARANLLAEPSPFASIEIETDAIAAWLGAFQGEDGAILILGTGSCGLAVAGGRQSYVGGWGAEVSDEASGHWIGREALRRTLWAHDGRAAATLLTEKLIARHGGSGEGVIAFATTARPADYAALAPLVFEHAEAGDVLALALVNEAAADAARIIARLIEVGAPAVALIGGLAEPLSTWLPPSARQHLVKARGDALDGAILIARRALAAARSAAAETS
ncbi:MAG: BadF/BadG/BcrA/BcrD ATPase family protein [Propylenella sp.]